MVKGKFMKIVLSLAIIISLFILYMIFGIRSEGIVCNKCGISGAYTSYELFWWFDKPIILYEKFDLKSNAYSDFLGACSFNKHNWNGCGGQVKGLLGDSRGCILGRGLESWPLYSRDKKTFLEFLNSEHKKSKDFKKELHSYMIAPELEESKTFRQKMHGAYEKFVANKSHD